MGLIPDRAALVERGRLKFKALLFKLDTNSDIYLVRFLYSRTLTPILTAHISTRMRCGRTGLRCRYSCIRTGNSLVQGKSRDLVLQSRRWLSLHRPPLRAALCGWRDLFIRIGWYIGITSANFTIWFFVWDYPNTRSTVGTFFKLLHWFNSLVSSDRGIDYSGLTATHSCSLPSSSLGTS